MRQRIWQCSCIVLVSVLYLTRAVKGDEPRPLQVEMAPVEVAEAPGAPGTLQPLQSGLYQAPSAQSPAPTRLPETTAPQVSQEPQKQAPSMIQSPLVSSCPNGYCEPGTSCIDVAAPYCESAPAYGSCSDSVAYCDSSTCDQMFCGDCCCPLWTVRAGAIFLRRDNQDSFALTNGATPISVGDLAFRDYQAGPLVTVMRHSVLGSPSTLEFTYFSVRDSNTLASAGATTISTTPPINFGAQAVSVNYRSQLNSGEINLRRPWGDWLTILGGFRWVELRDELATDIGAGTSTHNINVNNHLYGFQLGADAVLLRRGAFSIESFGKAGIYGNSADQSTTTTNIVGAVPVFGTSDSRAAFLGELALTGVYDLTSHWSVRGGYQALWFDDIALAPNQIANSNITTGVATLDSGSQPIYHGFTAAVQCSW